MWFFQNFRSTCAFFFEIIVFFEKTGQYYGWFPNGKFTMQNPIFHGIYREDRVWLSYGLVVTAVICGNRFIDQRRKIAKASSPFRRRFFDVDQCSYICSINCLLWLLWQPIYAKIVPGLPYISLYTYNYIKILLKFMICFKY